MGARPGGVSVVPLIQDWLAAEQGVQRLMAHPVAAEGWRAVCGVLRYTFAWFKVSATTKATGSPT